MQNEINKSVAMLMFNEVRGFIQNCEAAKQQFPKQTHARSQNSRRFIFCTKASHISARRDVKCPETNDWTVAADIEEAGHGAHITGQMPSFWWSCRYCQRIDLNIAMHSKQKSLQICQ